MSVLIFDQGPVRFVAWMSLATSRARGELDNLKGEFSRDPAPEECSITKQQQPISHKLARCGERAEVADNNFLSFASQSQYQAWCIQLRPKPPGTALRADIRVRLLTRHQDLTPSMFLLLLDSRCSSNLDLTRVQRSIRAVLFKSYQSYTILWYQSTGLLN